MSKVVWRFFQRKAGREDSEPKPLEPTTDQEAFAKRWGCWSAGLSDWMGIGLWS
jgi:hypothetical protein